MIWKEVNASFGNGLGSYQIWIVNPYPILKGLSNGGIFIEIHKSSNDDGPLPKF